MTNHRLARDPRPFRRTRFVAAGILLAGTVALIEGGGAGATVPAGEGSATAYTLAVLPKAGSLSVGVTLGEALAGHTNGVAKAQSQAIDLGAIGTSLTSYDCNSNPTLQPSQLPQALSVETGQTGAAQGQLVSDYAGAFTRYGLANATPYAKAITTIAPIGLAGIIDVGAGTATSWSGLVNGQRQAGATVTIGNVTLPGISLTGLQWSVLYQSTGAVMKTGSFSIAKATIGGVPVPTTNLDALFAHLNTILGPLGLALTSPTTHLTSGIEFVDPLQLSVVPNAARDNVLNDVLSGIQPVRAELFQAVLAAVCKADTAITVLDVALASIDGGGSLDIVLGGAQASSGTLGANGFDLNVHGNPSNTITLGGGSSGPALGDGPTDVPSDGPSVVPSTPALTSPPTTAASSPNVTPPAQEAIRPVSAVHDERGGALAWVALGGLALLALVAEADRRKMRRAQRATVQD